MTILHYMVSMGLHKTVWIPAHKYQHRNPHPLFGCNIQHIHECGLNFSNTI